MSTTFYMVTLGCPKNRVDSEVGWASLAEEGFQCVATPDEADVIVINTCAFVQDAVSESLDTIIELGRQRLDGRCELLVVTGCLAARYGRDLIKELGEVDLFLGSEELSKLGPRLKAMLDGSLQGETYAGSMQKGLLPHAATPRVNSLSLGAAYLKVAEGCNRKCSFCLIPKLRGPQRSMTLDDLVQQAENLVGVGVKELVLVAQDLADWGADLDGKPEIADLVEALCGTAGVEWVRLMYYFPSQLSDRLMELFEQHKNLLPYLDLPYQHADTLILRRMRRAADAKIGYELVRRIRERIPGVVLRSTLMTGFPGETDEAFERLLDWVQACRFERLGVFTFSPEEGTEAAVLSDQVPSELAKQRRDRLMSLQAEIAGAYHATLVGTRQDVLIESKVSEDCFSARAWNQAPEVDGHTTVYGACKPGSICSVRIVDAHAYDLTAEMVEDNESF